MDKANLKLMTVTYYVNGEIKNAKTPQHTTEYLSLTEHEAIIKELKEKAGKYDELCK